MKTAAEVAMWARKAREATVKRDDAIRRMRAEGASLRAIGEAAGLTAPGVQRVLDRGNPNP